MEKLNKIISSAVPIPMENVDTDQIIPARFLKAVTRDGFGANLFRDWRFDKQDNAIKDFVLNNPKYSGQVLLAGKNFGCGSSREHAAWAIHDYGFRVVISSFFADIFQANALNNGLLPIKVSDQDLDKLFKLVEQNPRQEFSVNLEHQNLNAAHIDISFEIDAYKKECLLNGHDDIDYLISCIPEIEEFEKKQLIY